VEIAFEIFGAPGPLRNAQRVEIGQDEFAQVLRRYDIGEEEADHFPPDDVLAPNAEIPVARPDIEVILAQQDIDPLIAPYVGRIETVRVVHEVIVEPRADPVPDLGCERSLAVEFAPNEQLRPVRRLGIRVRELAANETVPRGPRRPRPPFERVAEQSLARGG
jgi:hypothetical protein